MVLRKQISDMGLNDITLKFQKKLFFKKLTRKLEYLLITFRLETKEFFWLDTLYK